MTQLRRKEMKWVIHDLRARDFGGARVKKRHGTAVLEDIGRHV